MINPKELTDQGQEKKSAFRDNTENHTDFQSQLDIFTHISEGIAVLDKEWCITYINQRAAELLNLTNPEDLIGKNITEEFPEEIGREFYNAAHRAIETNQPVFQEDHNDSRDRYFENRIYPSSDGLTVYFNDVTERKNFEKELRESLNKLEEIQEIAHLGNWYIDIRDSSIQLSDEMYRIFGILKEKFDHSTDAFMDMIHPKDKDALQSWLDKSMAGIKLSALEFRVIRPDNEVCWIRGDGKPICDREGHPVAMIGSALDITDRKNAEERIRKDQAFIESIINASPNIIFIYDIKTGLPAYTNLNAKEYFGYSDKDIAAMGRKLLSKLFDPADYAFYIANIQSAYNSLNDKEILEYVCRLKTKRGEWRRFQCKEMVFSRDSDGKPAQIFGIFADITESKRLEREKRELEKTFQLALENIADVITIYGPDRKIQFVNEATRKITNLETVDFIGKFDEEVLPEEVVQVYKPVLDEVFEIHQARVIEDEIKFPDGRTFSLKITCIPVLDEKGDLIEVIGVTQDFTEKKKAEIQLKESEERYRLLVENSPYAICVYQDNQIIFVNPSAVRMLGARQPEELIGKSITDIIHEDDLEAAQDRIARLLNGESGLYPVEDRLIRLDGEVIYAEVTKASFLFRGKPAIQMIAVDVSDKKKVQQELDNEAVRRRILIEQSRDGIVILNQNGKVQEANLQAAKMLGYTPEEFAKLSVFDWDSNFSKEVLAQLLRDADESGEIIETRHKRKDGSIFDVEISTNASVFMGEKIIFNVIRDVTERKKAQVELENTLTQLRQAIATTIDVLIQAIEIRDPYTAGHQRRVADLARAIGTELSFSDEKIQGLRLAASIHDIGKISVPSEILSKPTKLTKTEFALVKEHAQYGYEILKDVESPWPLADIVHQHHEKMNGSGYPLGLKKDEILFESRILTVADVVEAMASHRPYRPSLGLEPALDEIKKNKGILYDEQVVDACIKIFTENKFSFEK